MAVQLYQGGGTGSLFMLRVEPADLVHDLLNASPACAWDCVEPQVSMVRIVHGSRSGQGDALEQVGCTLR